MHSYPSAQLPLEVQLERSIPQLVVATQEPPVQYSVEPQVWSYCQLPCTHWKTSLPEQSNAPLAHCATHAPWLQLKPFAQVATYCQAPLEQL